MIVRVLIEVRSSRPDGRTEVVAETRRGVVFKDSSPKLNNERVAATIGTLVDATLSDALMQCEHIGETLSEG